MSKLKPRRSDDQTRQNIGVSGPGLKSSRAFGILSEGRRRVIENSVIVLLLVVAAFAFLFLSTISASAGFVTDWISELAWAAASRILSWEDSVQALSHSFVSAMGIFLAGLAGGICIHDSKAKKVLWLCGFLVLYGALLYCATPLFEDWQWTTCEADGSHCSLYWDTYIMLASWLICTPTFLFVGAFIGSKLMKL